MSSAPALNAGDTAWLLAAAALVMLMTPALGFFYGGLVRRKNVLSTLMHSWFILALISVQWVLWGYSLAFSPDTGLGIIGGRVPENEEVLGLDTTQHGEVAYQL
jgi:ammonium transporter, Amt family